MHASRLGRLSLGLFKFIRARLAADAANNHVGILGLDLLGKGDQLPIVLGVFLITVANKHVGHTLLYMTIDGRDHCLNVLVIRQQGIAHGYPQAGRVDIVDLVEFLAGRYMQRLEHGRRVAGFFQIGNDLIEVLYVNALPLELLEDELRGEGPMYLVLGITLLRGRVDIIENLSGFRVRSSKSHQHNGRSLGGGGFFRRSGGGLVQRDARYCDH